MNLDDNFQKHSILIIDDNPANLSVISDHLAEYGFDVLVTRSGKRGLEIARNAQPAVILLDIMMPKMDGFETCRHLKANETTRNIPVIFMTALAETKNKVRGFQAGAVDYITKPFQEEEVLARVTTHLHLRELTERLEQKVEERTRQLTASNQQLQQKIAERKQTEQTLQESSAQMKALIESPKNIIIFSLDKNYRYTAFNSNHQKEMKIIYGVDIEKGMNLLKLIDPPEIREKTKQSFDRVLAGESFTEVQHQVGAPIYYEFYWNPIVAENGAIIGITSFIQNVSERKQIEEERKALIFELEAKNTELERFTYTVSHDLKSPLITIEGFLGMLEQDARKGNSNRLNTDIQYIRDAAEIMKQLLDDLLELSRIGRLTNPPQIVSLDKLVNEAKSLVAGQILEHGVHVEIKPNLPPIFGDRPRLLEVFQNLIDNAVKFMGAQSKPYVEIGAEIEDTFVVCYVKDNGIGIAPSYHDKVFGLFNRLDADSDGTGIGLALVKRIVEVHGGHVWIKSDRKNKGSTFFVSLPRQKP